MGRSVASFREHAETYIVFKSLNDNVLSLIILKHVPKSVPLSYHRKDSHEVHYLCNELPFEHIGSGTEYALVAKRLQHDQCIH